MDFLKIAKKNFLKYRTIITLFFILLALLIIYLGFAAQLNAKMNAIYQSNQSFSVSDRNNKIIFLQANDKGDYAQYSNTIPQRFKDLLLKKEDKYFYWHWGFNIWGILQVLGNKLGLFQREGSSTITQQLAKILLAQENQRNINNKLQEAFYTISLELFNSKDEILQMYVNSIYFGNQMQGLESASHGYFGVDPQNLTDEQILQLLATINSPTDYNPAGNLNIDKAKSLASILGIKADNFTKPKECRQNLQNYSQSNQPVLELAGYLQNNINKNIQLTIDNDLSRQVRSIVSENMQILKTKKAKNAAVVILSIPDNQILTLIGSPDPNSYSDGYQINMATKPRQIGSTIKPFIYLLGFEKGMRPYTLIDDREYKYPTANGYSIYPKNFDYKYHGLMTAHYALSNSINVAAVKTLDFIGLDNFSKFLTEDLQYSPPQPIDNYQLGIALGAMEIDLLNLSHYFSIFANKGKLTGLQLFNDGEINKNYFLYQNKTIAPGSYIELVIKILNDRKTGIDQFGAESDLNLPVQNYALKTGTSHDFKDSWIIGYTPNFLVGVWIGNADNSATDGVSGQLGAGRIWNQVMQIMLNSNYNYNTQFNFSDIKDYQSQDGVDFGLASDNFDQAQNIIENRDEDFILNPHEGDVFLFQPDAKIPLKAKTSAEWIINNQDFDSGQEVIFIPQKEGRYQITASSKSQNQTVNIWFVKQ